MALPSGRRFLWDLLSRCHIYESTVEGSDTGEVDPYRVVLNEGERQVGLYLVDEMTGAAPRLWLQMQMEQVESRIASDKKTAGKPAGKDAENAIDP